jgi:hypothetical protein
VNNRKDHNPSVVKPEEHHVRETIQQSPSDSWADFLEAARHGSNLKEDLIQFRHELPAQTGTLSLVPTANLADVCLRLPSYD